MRLAISEILTPGRVFGGNPNVPDLDTDLTWADLGRVASKAREGADSWQQEARCFRSPRPNNPSGRMQYNGVADGTVESQQPKSVVFETSSEPASESSPPTLVVAESRQITSKLLANAPRVCACAGRRSAGSRVLTPYCSNAVRRGAIIAQRGKSSTGSHGRFLPQHGGRVQVQDRCQKYPQKGTNEGATARVGKEGIASSVGAEGETKMDLWATAFGWSSIAVCYVQNENLNQRRG